MSVRVGSLLFQGPAKQTSLSDEVSPFLPCYELTASTESKDFCEVIQLPVVGVFGGGSHPTTRLILHWLQLYARTGALDGAYVLDYGCGTGVLALASLALGASRATAVDIEPESLRATLANASANPRLYSRTGEQGEDESRVAVFFPPSAALRHDLDFLCRYGGDLTPFADVAGPLPLPPAVALAAVYSDYFPQDTPTPTVGSTTTAEGSTGVVTTTDAPTESSPTAPAPAGDGSGATAASESGEAEGAVVPPAAACPLFDVAFVNIVPGPLARAARHVAARLRPGAVVALAGFEIGLVGPVVAAYAPYFELLDVDADGGRTVDALVGRVAASSDVSAASRRVVASIDGWGLIVGRRRGEWCLHGESL
eukprot:TRINITY_DN6092_c0_g1_i1.p1 TRINITY_DN6092_c0_g1~~TRINITY_DN6092_c0_g1_i1.p1  ORF type:complete len:379 (-),score=51.84 TRINITY_DN6092_c0_g1_i1:74-1177(-)